MYSGFSFVVFFFNDTATTEIYTLSLHDALPISSVVGRRKRLAGDKTGAGVGNAQPGRLIGFVRSEEHTSELQSRLHLVCRLLLEYRVSRSASPPQGAAVRRRRALRPQIRARIRECRDRRPLRASLHVTSIGPA